MKIYLAIVILGGLVAVSCTNSKSPLSVEGLLNSADRYNNQRIIVEGTILRRHGLLNLFNRNSDECVGLILAPTEISEFRKYSGRKISLVGSFEAEGCGEDGICDEHLCGPGVLTKVSILGNSHQNARRKN